MADTQTQSSFNTVVATAGAAGGVGALILLLYPSHRAWAVYAAILILLVGLGVVAWFEGVV